MKHQFLSKSIWIVLLLSVAISSCKKEPIVEPPIPKSPDTQSYSMFSVDSSVIVINEGQFQMGNSSIYHYNEVSQTLETSIYKAVNGIPLGDITQSMTVSDSTGYIVVNNSAPPKIEVMAMDSFNVKAIITGFTSPRYFFPLGDGRAYVSNLFGGKIDIVNLSSNTITGSISINSGWSEQMVKANGKIYVGLADTNLVAVIDPATDVVSRYITVNKGPSGIVKDALNTIWVLSDGGWGSEFPELARIDPQADTITERHTFTDINQSPSKLTLSPDGSKLYYLNGGVCQFNVQSGSIQAPYISAPISGVFYGLGVNNDGSKIYVGDAIDFVQNGKVYIYDAISGSKIKEFSTGVNPNGFVFL